MNASEENLYVDMLGLKGLNERTPIIYTIVLAFLEQVYVKDQ